MHVDMNGQPDLCVLLFYIMLGTVLILIMGLLEPYYDRIESVVDRILYAKHYARERKRMRRRRSA